jgi:monothiol glutaredoxin
MSLDQETRQRLDALIASDEVVLFMKGNRSFPQCGFSATVVQILNSLVPTYTTVNVLSDAAIRQGIKEFSEWPTIPQLYVRGEFIGGCDIVREMFESGELRTVLGAGTVTPPTIHLTDTAAKVLGAALADAGPNDRIHLAIDAGFNHSLEIGPRTDSAIEATDKGVTIVVEPMSVQRANGLIIDYVESESGFKMDNPNRPPEVSQLTPSELKTKLAAGEIAELIDVRSQGEHDIAHIEGAKLLDEDTMQRLTQIDVNTPLAFYCHHGHRSLAAAEHFRDRGFRKVYNLAGGIDAWSREVDPSVKRY